MSSGLEETRVRRACGFERCSACWRWFPQPAEGSYYCPECGAAELEGRLAVRTREELEDVRPDRPPGS